MPEPRRPIEIREFPRPDLEPDQRCCARPGRRCGTDVHLWHGRLAGVPYPIIPGHVSAGTLESIRGTIPGIDGSNLREAIARSSSMSTGHAAAAAPAPCIARRRNGREARLRHHRFGLRRTVRGLVATSISNPALGSPGSLDKVGFDDYIGGGCGLLTAVHVSAGGAPAGRLRRRPGAGAVGLSVVALARLGGASTIVLIGGPPERLTLGRAMGADVVFDISRRQASKREQRPYAN